MEALTTPVLARTPDQPLSDEKITGTIELLFVTKREGPSHLLEVSTHQGIVELTGLTDTLLARDRAQDIALAVRSVRGVVNEVAICAPHVPDGPLALAVSQALRPGPASGPGSVRSHVAQGVVTLSGTLPTLAEKQRALRAVAGVRGVQALDATALRVAATGPPQSDAEISRQLQESLAWEVRLNPRLVRAWAADQVVYLAGTVGTAAQKARLEALAMQAGAARVDGQDLRVSAWALEPGLRPDEPAPPSDAELARAVRDTLHHDPRMRASQLLVQVSRGIVTLVGTVGNLRARQTAEQDAGNVPGVGQVRNLLKVRPARHWHDAEVRQNILDTLARDLYVGHLRPQVQVTQGCARLGGPVDNHFHQAHSLAVAAGVTGVLALEDHLVVAGTPEPAPAAGPAPTPAMPTADHDLAASIRARCCWSAHLHQSYLEVQAENGRVTLTGTVASPPMRRQVAAEARAAGARDVNNHVRVDRSATTA